MKKIPTLFERDWSKAGNPITDRVAPECQWVADGEGEATRKFDGTACLFHRGVWYRRHTRRIGFTPTGFIAADVMDERRGKQEGWIPVSYDRPEDKYHREAIAVGKAFNSEPFVDGETYELCGPKIQGGAEPFQSHLMVRHGMIKQLDVPRDFEGLRDYLSRYDIEGIVWWHSDGRKAKIKGKDFGIKRGWPRD